MSVKRKSDHAMEGFIDAGSPVKSTGGSGFRNILVRVPLDILDRLEEKLEEKPWLNRTQWVVEAIHERLERSCILGDE